MKTGIHRFIFFLGWLLSPLTFWNDAFINIPLAYLLACLTVSFIPASFLSLTVIYYWITNGLGIILMVASGRKIFQDRARVIKEVSILVITIILYSAVLILLDKTGILKPIRLH